MVEMVLLGLPCLVDTVWNAGFSVWRRAGCAGWCKYQCRRISGNILWISPRLCWSCRSCRLWFCTSFCFHFRVFHQSTELPKSIVVTHLTEFRQSMTTSYMDIVQIKFWLRNSHSFFTFQKHHSCLRAQVLVDNIVFLHKYLHEVHLIITTLDILV